VSALVDRGVREVTLLGQTVNSYRDPSAALAPAPGHDESDPDESEFAALLRAIAERVPGLVRLRYTSPHPRHLVPSLVRAHAELDVLPRHVHLPVQSGSNRLLKRMIRRYTREEYLRRLDALRTAAPGTTLSTDIIVGFPGETDDDFEATLSLVREAGFVGVFGFKYSQRPYTPALKLDDDVSEADKSARLARLFELSESLLADHLAGLVGSKQRVLVEGPSKRGATDDGPAPRTTPGERRTTYTGRTDRNEIVHLDDAAAAGLVGEVVEIEVVRALRHSLVGAIDEATRARGLARAPAVEAARGARRQLPVLVAEGHT
jgi:tRNA-2-methylthio-N6-dimethylallyladenosine synthase